MPVYSLHDWGKSQRTAWQSEGHLLIKKPLVKNNNDAGVYILRWAVPHVPDQQSTTLNLKFMEALLQYSSFFFSSLPTTGYFQDVFCYSSVGIEHTTHIYWYIWECIGESVIVTVCSSSSEVIRSVFLNENCTYGIEWKILVFHDPEYIHKCPKYISWFLTWYWWNEKGRTELRG